jgi:hypothetical protein
MTEDLATVSEKLIAQWLDMPWHGLPSQIAAVEQMGGFLLDDPKVLSAFRPKGLIQPIEFAVAAFDGEGLPIFAFGEMDMGQSTAGESPFMREIWLLSATDERPWFSLLCEVLGSEPHARTEPTDPPVRSWIWIDPRVPDHLVRLTPYPDGGIKISQIRGIQVGE